VERATINLELKKVMRRTAFYSIASSFFILLIYPEFFVNRLAGYAFMPMIVSAVYILSAFLRDWPMTFEQDALFRIIKRTTASDHELATSILKLNAFANSGAIFFNFIGIVAGWLAMGLNSMFGVILSLAGALASLSKLLYPYYGSDFNLSVTLSLFPFFSSDQEVEIIPDKVFLRSNTAIRLQKHGSGHAFYDDDSFSIVVQDPQYEPVISEKSHHRLHNRSRSWTLSWKHKGEKAKVRIVLKNKKSDLWLNAVQNGNLLIYALQPDDQAGG
jgi:hypothetical protein